MDVLLRQYCRTAEENDILYDEIEDIRNALKTLLTENADLRFILRSAGLELPPSEFIVVDDDDDFDPEAIDVS